MSRETPRYDGCIVPILLASIAAFVLMFYVTECSDYERNPEPTPVIEETVPNEGN